MQWSHCYGGKLKDEPTNEAMAVNHSSLKGKSSKGAVKKPQGACCNCGETGYFKDKCPKPKVDKSTNNLTKKEKEKENANAAAEHNSDSESEGAWVAVDSNNELIFLSIDDTSSSNDDTSSSNDG